MGVARNPRSPRRKFFVWRVSEAACPCSADEFRNGVAEVAELHAKDALFGRTVVSEPAPAEPVGWAMLTDAAEHAEIDEIDMSQELRIFHGPTWSVALLCF